MERDSRKLIRLLEQAGWYEVGQTGSHLHFRHAHRNGRVTVPHPNKDIKTVRL